MSTQKVPGTALGWVELHGEDEEAAWRDVWQQNVYQLGEEHLHGAVVIDVGSNIGLFTAFALHHGASYVLAVDPIAEHHERAHTLIGDENGAFVSWILAAAGDGCARIRGPGVGPSQTMVRSWAGPIDEEPPWVEGVTLDNLVVLALAHDAERIIVKVDCEGCEFDLIESASDRALADVWRFTMEWHGMMGAVRESARGRIGAMVDRLLDTHSVTVYGDPNHGGMLYAYRY